MGNEVAIDLDFLRDPILAKRAYDIAIAAFGETPLVRQGQAPKTALLYRAAEPIATIKLKAANGSGDGVDIIGDGAQLVAFGIHPDTIEPYRWVGAETPLTATPDDAPAISCEQIRAFLTELGRFVELTNGGGNKTRGRGGRGGFGTIVRNAEGLVVDGREAWLTLIVHRTAVELHAEGVSVEATALVARAWATFENTTALADGKWTLQRARRKAEALIRRVKAGKVKLDGLKPAEPSYADNRHPLPEAEAAVADVVNQFFAEHVPAWKEAVRRWKKAKESGWEELVPKAVPTSWGARVETAIGKTEALITTLEPDGFQALTVARMVAKAVAPGVRRAVSTTVRTAASPSAAHMAR
jgi:hypothetical protein